MNIETSPCSRGKVELIPIAVFVAHYRNSCLTQVRISVLVAQYSYSVAVTFVSNRW